MASACAHEAGDAPPHVHTVGTRLDLEPPNTPAQHLVCEFTRSVCEYSIRFANTAFILQTRLFGSQTQHSVTGYIGAFSHPMLSLQT